MNELEIPTFSEEELFPQENEPASNSEAEEEDFKIVTPSDLGEEVLEEEESNDEQVIAVYKTLVEKNILEENEEFGGTWEDLDKEFSNIPSKIKESLINNSSPVLKSVLEFAMADPNNLTKEDLKTFVNTYLEETQEPKYKEFTQESAKEYLLNHFKSTLGEEEAEVVVEMLDDKDQLLEKARALDEEANADKRETYQNLIKERAEAAKNREKAQKEFASKIIQEIDSTKWSEKRKNSVKEVLANNTLYNTLESAYTSPKAITQLAQLSMFYDDKKGVFDLDEYIKQVASKEINSFKTNLLKNKFGSTKSTASGNSKPATDTLVPFLD